MDDDEIRKLVAQLETGVPREGAAVRWNQLGGPGECELVASKRGYLRLGIEFLKAALAPSDDPRSDSVPVDVEYLFTRDSDYRFDVFRRRDDLRVIPTELTWGQRTASFLIIGALILGTVFACIGFVWTLRAVF